MVDMPYNQTKRNQTSDEQIVGQTGLFNLAMTTDQGKENV